LKKGPNSALGFTARTLSFSSIIYLLKILFSPKHVGATPPLFIAPLFQHILSEILLGHTEGKVRIAVKVSPWVPLDHTLYGSVFCPLQDSLILLGGHVDMATDFVLLGI